MVAVKTTLALENAAQNSPFQPSGAITSRTVQDAIEQVGSVAADAASRELDNLENVAINTDLIPGTDNTHDLGSPTRSWQTAYIGDGGLGINTDPDATNKLSVNSAAVLFNHNGASSQVKVNKAANGDTASHLFQVGFSGRAEFGLVGSNDFQMKTSPDGSAFTTGLTILAADAGVRVGVNLSPAANDGAALGTTALRWADLFGATGFVVNFNNDWIATHSAGIVTVGTGELRISTPGTNAASVVTVGGTQTLTSKTVNLTNNTLSGTLAQFNTAVSDADLASLAGAETLTNKSIALGSNTISGTTAQFNTALSDGDFATLAGAATLTNKTLALGSNTVSGSVAEFNAALTGDDFGTLAAASTWTAVQTFSGQTPVQITWVDAGATEGPRINLFRDSASPAASDLGPVIGMQGRNSVAATTTYGKISTNILDPTDGTEDGEVVITAVTGGSLVATLKVANGIQIGSPTGGYMGAGSINFAGSLYANGVLVESDLTVGTVQASTSGTAIDFNSLPASIKRVTILFDQVSLSGTDNLLVQLGDSGGLETTGYTSVSEFEGSLANGTTGFIIRVAVAARNFTGHMVISRVTANTWISSHHGGDSAAAASAVGGGRKSLSAELDRIRITRTGTDTFDAGQINIMYE
jgi:hypothetical protein